MQHIGTRLNYKRKTNSNKSSITLQGLLCIFIGVFIGFSIATWLRTKLLNCAISANNCCISNLNDNSELIGDRTAQYADTSDNNALFKNIEPSKNLVFVGVMTAQKYLDTRAKAVYQTWGQRIPGKMSFFSRAGSTSQYPIPLVSLPGVDDSYPPQKKSFMMLKYIHDNYIDKFEWFMRVDDDVYIKPDKLEQFLRSLNSSKPQFIGQAGLGNKDEFGTLWLNDDENFCMGGPGIVMSRETLKRVVPNISYCLKNLYSTHEDVEIGRCVRRFAGIPCTWSYEMQHIFHHNSSGNEAFTKELLSRDVLRAISLHPVKQSQYQYRLHNFFNMRKLIDLRQKNLQLQREIYNLENLISKLNSNLTKTVIINENLNELTNSSREDRFNLKPSFFVVKPPAKRKHRHDFSYFSRSIYSSAYVSPKRGAETYWKKAISDSMRQIMEDINKNSIQRGRIIDFKDVLYAYMRHHPLYGIDYIIDALLVYRKYEGRKMTVNVRRHAYVRQTYTDMIFREDNAFDSIYHHREKLRNTNDELEHNSEVYDMNTSSESSIKNGNFLKKLINFVFPVENVDENQERDKRDASQFFAKSDELTHEKLNGDKQSNADTSHNDVYNIDWDINRKVIHFIVPLSGRLEIFKRFIQNFENICLKNNEKVKLAVILFATPNENELSNQVNSIIDNLKTKYSNDNLRVVTMNANFSRSVACEIGAALYSAKSLLFFIDVDIIFTREFLLRVRLNTIEGKQVYFPIVFSEYDPDPGLETGIKRTGEIDHYEFTSETGYWRQFGFGIVAVYNSDLRRVGGFDTSIIGWGKEDVDLFEKFVKFNNITIFRTVDPGLVHVFHKIKCDPNLPSEQMVMCWGSKSTSIASQRVLSQLIYKHRLYLIKFNSTTIIKQTSTSKIDSQTKTTTAHVKQK